MDEIVLNVLEKPIMLQHTLVEIAQNVTIIFVTTCDY